MKKVILAIALALICGSFASMAQDSNVGVAQTTSNDYVDFFFNGYNFKIPQGLPVNMENNEATVRNSDGTFGISIKSEKDTKASAAGAYEICKRTVTDLHLGDAKLSKVNIYGLEGARVTGNLEGMHVAVEILDTGKRYMKIVTIYTDAHTADAETLLSEITKG